MVARYTQNFEVLKGLSKAQLQEKYDSIEKEIEKLQSRHKVLSYIYGGGVMLLALILLMKPVIWLALGIATLTVSCLISIVVHTNTIIDLQNDQSLLRIYIRRAKS